MKQLKNIIKSSCEFKTSKGKVINSFLIKFSPDFKIFKYKKELIIDTINKKNENENSLL